MTNKNFVFAKAHFFIKMVMLRKHLAIIFFIVSCLKKRKEKVLPKIQFQSLPSKISVVSVKMLPSLLPEVGILCLCAKRGWTWRFFDENIHLFALLTIRPFIQLKLVQLTFILSFYKSALHLQKNNKWTSPFISRYVVLERLQKYIYFKFS